MGQSTNAIIFYGFCLPEECEENDIAEDYENIYAEVCGVPEPTGVYEENKQAYSDYWDKKQALLLASECGIGTHCSGEYPIYYVHISKSEIVNYRGDETAITKNTLDVKDHWNKSIKDFCKKLGITYSKPEWLLVSYWG